MYQQVVDEAATTVMRWLGVASSFFIEHSPEADQQVILDRINQGIGEPASVPEAEERRNNQKILLFIGRRNGEVVAAGFCQFGALNGAIQKIGVRTDDQHTGVGKAMFKWIFSGLAQQHAGQFVMLGVYRENEPMLNFMRKLEATTPDNQPWWGTPAQRTATEETAVFLQVQINTACEVLGCPPPSGTEYNLDGRTVDGVTFTCLYFGRHPARLKRGEHPVVNSL